MSVTPHEKPGFQQAFADAGRMPMVPDLVDEITRADIDFKPPGMQLTPLRHQRAKPSDPNTYDPGLNHETNGYLQDMVTERHASIFASKMMDKRDKMMKVIHFQCKSN